VSNTRLAASGPNVIGATGGSGTRAFARIARLAGLYIGESPTEAEDAAEFGEYSDCWINAYLSHRDSSPPAWLEPVMRSDLAALVERHLRGHSGPGPWGWKEPRSIYLLPHYDASLPQLRFLHVVRDGRDMAFSANQNQLRKHGGAYLRRPVDIHSPGDSIELWSQINLEAARYGSEQLGNRYLRLRFEDLCREPTETAAQIVDFFGLAGDPTALSSDVAPQESTGRWQSRDRTTVAALERIAGDALTALGYTGA
jgi:hypothetical protein